MARVPAAHNEASSQVSSADEAGQLYSFAITTNNAPLSTSAHELGSFPRQASIATIQPSTLSLSPDGSSFSTATTLRCNDRLSHTSPSHIPPRDDQRAVMPKVPLLMRSSPAQGTGSYGALPIHHVGSSPDTSDIEHVRAAFRNSRRERRKGRRSFDLRTSLESDSGPSTTPDRSTSRPAKRKHLELSHTRSNGDNGSKKRRAAGDIDDPAATDAVLSQARGDPGIKIHATQQFPAVDNVDPLLGKTRSSSSYGSISSVSTDASSLSGDDSSLDVDKADESDPPDNSPYAQVRASVKATDDFTLSINTPRMWVLSVLFAVLGSSTNLFFSLRYPSVSITPVIALLMVHPLGLFWDSVLKRTSDPDECFIDGNRQSRRDAMIGDGGAQGDTNSAVDCSLQSQQTASQPTRAFGTLNRARLWLGQGRWNEKEHCCVYIASNVSFGFAFATDVIVEQTKFYGQKLGVDYQILLIISSQVLGYAIAGLTRRFLVRPSGMIWPGTLISASMFTTLHEEENKPANGWTITRSRFFMLVFGGSAAFYFLPGLLFPALSYFNVITWFAPDSVVLANLFGTASGLGMFPVTFDWAQIAYIGSPLAVPFWAAMNIFGGLLIVMWIIAPILYYANTLYSSYMPILSSAVFDNTGRPYSVSKILNADYTFDEEAYKQYSPLFLPITYALSYALQFAALAALITHTACWHGKDIVKQWQRSWVEIRQQSNQHIYRPLSQGNGTTRSRSRNRYSLHSTTSEPGLENIMAAEDVHNRLMRRYDDVPMWWYLVIAVSMTAIAIFVVEYYPIHLPWYGLLLALGICTVLFIPIGIVMAIANQQSSLYLICQLICGSVFPGRPVANMVFVTYGYITSTQGLKFSSDMKLGHYMKVPPRLLFSLQITATIISSLTQIGVLNWMLSNIPGICTPQAINGFTCPIARVHFNGSILWGVVGPARFFGKDALYRPLIWAFLVGAIAPLGVYYMGRKKKRSIWSKVNLPVLFGSLSWIPPATGLNFSVWAVICYVFNDVIRRRKSEWWGKYVMTLSAALDSGVALGVVVIFFGIVYPGWMKNFTWWGTEVYKQGCDWQACSYKNMPPGQRFGPDSW